MKTQIFHLDERSLHKYNELNTYSYNRLAFSTREISILLVLAFASLYIGFTLGVSPIELSMLTA